MVESRVGFIRSVFAALGYGAALVLLLCSGSVLAQDTPDFIADCSGCTQQVHYAFAAADKVPDPSTHVRTTRTWSVYVANSAKSHVEAFQVVVQPLDNGGGPPPDFPGIPNSTFYEFGPYKTVWPVVGDPQVKAAVVDAISIVHDFLARLEGPLDGTDITNVDSAISLVGPEDSPAGLARLQLRSDLKNHYNSIWTSFLFNTGDLVGMAAQKILAESSLDGPTLVIQFEDGTSIEVKIESVSPELNGLGIFVDFTVLTHTALLPDGTVVPQTAGQFSGYSWNDGPGTNIGAQLALLAALYGLEVGEPGDGMDCDFDCWGSQQQCRLTCRP